jgi:hypothetical protein
MCPRPRKAERLACFKCRLAGKSRANRKAPPRSGGANFEAPTKSALLDATHSNRSTSSHNRSTAEQQLPGNLRHYTGEFHGTQQRNEEEPKLLTQEELEEDEEGIRATMDACCP